MTQALILCMGIHCRPVFRKGHLRAVVRKDGSPVDELAWLEMRAPDGLDRSVHTSMTFRRALLPLHFFFASSIVLSVGFLKRQLR